MQYYKQKYTNEGAFECNVNFTSLTRILSTVEKNQIKKTINKNKKGKGIIGNRGNTSFDSVSFL